MRRGLARVLVAMLLPLAACASEDSDELPPCRKVAGSPVVAPGLKGSIAFRTTGFPVQGYYHCLGIFMMNADGSGLRRVTPAPEIYPSGARRSPDGRQFVFTGACPDTQHMELCLVNEDGTDVRPLSTTGAGHFAPVYDAYPAWSPDGSRIVFSRRLESLGPGDLYVINRDGTGEVRLTSDPGDERSPVWSPDGQTVVYTGNDRQLRVVKAAGGPSTVLAPGGTVNESPAFSHDGRRIAFSSNRAAKPESAYSERVRQTPGSEWLPRTGAHDIYVVGIDGKGLTRLTSDASANYAPSWSPDDRHIAFISDREGSHHLFVMDAGGGNVVRLSPFDAGDPDWSR